MRPTHDSATAAPNDALLDRLRHAVEHAAHLLPAQGPITTFIHHNTLHAFEDLPFTEAVEKAGRVFGCQPYLKEERYRTELRRGRIEVADVNAILRQELGTGGDEPVILGCTRRRLRAAMLEHSLRTGPTAELLWYVAETDALRRVNPEASATARLQLIAETRHWALRDLREGDGAAGRTPDWARGLVADFRGGRMETWSDAAWEGFALLALWRVCRLGAASAPTGESPSRGPVRPRDLLLAATGIDVDRAANDVLIRFCAAFLDQGVAAWTLPGRDSGCFRAFLGLHRQPAGPPTAWRRALAHECARLDDAKASPLDSIRESLDRLGVHETEWEPFLAATVLALRGWGGMVRQVEERSDRVVRPIPEGSLVEFVAVRLLVDRVAACETLRTQVGPGATFASLREEQAKKKRAGAGAEQRAFTFFQLAQFLAWTPERLGKLAPADWARLTHEVEAFSDIDRRRVFHLAYERHFYSRVLDALALRRTPSTPPAGRPRFQAMVCIDDREESLRRHLEELAPDCETFGIAGFYFLDMHYRGVADAHFSPLCPAILRPRRRVAEAFLESGAQAGERRRVARRTLGRVSHRVHLGSRAFVFGAVLSAAAGVLASAPLIARTFFPRVTARIRALASRIVQPPKQTQLDLFLPDDAATDPEASGFRFGELVDIAERVLRDTGLTSNFSRVVLTLGHGSSSSNNPHFSAYECGACGGGNGGPNGRGVALALNDPRVRDALRTRGIDVPSDTVFVGGWHNTSNDQVTFSDLDLLPETHRAEFDAVRAIFEQACERDAHERCRRFETAPLFLSPKTARAHVESRTEDLAQVRPELGHVTNAVCIVGRRLRSRGLFYDRRAFLNSYDPTQDDADGTILGRILRAAGPVCAGISLEYYFSHVDNAGYGCGTKLPHNITSLLGVMDGAASDLRTGLPWQMVEIHEAVRILFVAETTPETMIRVMDREAVVGQLVRNGWVQLALLDPHSQTIRVFRDGAFEAYRPSAEHLPTASTSADWYRGWRDHVDFAEIVPDREPAKE